MNFIVRAEFVNDIMSSCSELILLTCLSLIRITLRTKYSPHDSARGQQLQKSITIFSIAMVRMWKQKYKRAANTDTQIADPTTERQDLGPSQLASGELSIKKLIPVGDLFEEDVDMTKYDTEGTADEHVAFVTMVDIKKEKLYSFNEQCLHRRLTADICLPNYRPHHVDSSFASPTRNWDLLWIRLCHCCY